VCKKSALSFLALLRRQLNLSRRTRDVIPEVLNAKDFLRHGKLLGIAMFRVTTHPVDLTSSVGGP
jgi:hypothetical protein